MPSLSPKQLSLIRAVAEAEQRELPNFYKCAKVLAVAAEEQAILTPEEASIVFGN